MSKMVPFDFEGSRLDVLKSDGVLWVSIRRVCEALGLDEWSQQRKLAGKPWAVTVIMTATGPDGKNYGSSMIDLDALPMWLATIDAGRVAEAARPKLDRFQLGCSRVLRDHFFPREPEPVNVHAPIASIGDSPIARRDVAAWCTVAAKTQGVSLQRVHGAVRRTCHSTSIYLVPLVLLEHVKAMLQEMVHGRLLLPSPRRGKLVALPTPKQRELFS